MTQKPIPRDPHADNDLIDSMESEPGAQSGSIGHRVAQNVASRDEEASAGGGDPLPTGATKSDSVQPRTSSRSDHQGQQTVGSDFD
jgi:hypothetical protein